MFFAATDNEARPRTLIVGLGNPILGDDGVGWRVVDVLEQRLGIDSWAREAIGPLELDRLSVGGLTLMERLVGYERALVVDAEIGDPPGAVRVTSLGELDARPPAHLDSAHDVSLARAIELARDLGSMVPPQIVVVTIGISATAQFEESLSPAVEAAVEPAVDLILDRLTVAIVN